LASEDFALVERDDAKQNQNEPSDANLDALPYIDAHYADESLKAEVEKLVGAEMEVSPLTPEEYLIRRNLAIPDLQFINSTFLETEWKRVQERRGLSPFDTSRYSVDPPLEEEKGQIVAWQKAVQNAKAQIENQTNRIVNLELMKRYGGHAWKTYNQSLTVMEKSYEILMKEKKKMKPTR